MKIPFSWFGGKRKIASIVWSGLGEVSNYVEPFAGSLAVLLAAPQIPKIETINDLDCGLANFWRSVSFSSEEVAKWADCPVNETELHARHKWLIERLTIDFRQKMDSDPDFYDARMAGYWIWGQGASVGNNWLQPKGVKALPLLSSAGGGIHGLTYNIQEDFKKLQTRLRRVRVACGDWTRVVTPGITHASKGLGDKDITGVFLDPPYEASVRDKVYKEDKDIFKQVCQWAIDNGDNKRMRIVLCGYEGDHGIPETWQTFSWKTGGGMSALGNGRGKDNASKEVIYFSPHCLKVNII
jgi:site-specific DNA-adenine methylase